MKGLTIILILLVILISNLNVKAQASWNTQFTFIIRDKNNQAININEFKEQYELINVFGDTVSSNDLVHYLTFNEKNNYFILNIETIGPRFSFALSHNNNLMIIYLPFVHEYNYYAIDFKFRSGKFLFDFDITEKEKIYFNSNMPQYIIKKINWRKQAKKIKKSDYSDDKTYNTNCEK